MQLEWTPSHVDDTPSHGLLLTGCKYQLRGTRLAVLTRVLSTVVRY